MRFKGGLQLILPPLSPISDLLFVLCVCILCACGFVVFPPRKGEREEKGSQREPKGTKRKPKGSQTGAKRRPKMIQKTARMKNAPRKAPFAEPERKS